MVFIYGVVTRETTPRPFTILSVAHPSQRHVRCVLDPSGSELCCALPTLSFAPYHIQRRIMWQSNPPHERKYIVLNYYYELESHYFDLKTIRIQNYTFFNIIIDYL